MDQFLHQDKLQLDNLDVQWLQNLLLRLVELLQQLVITKFIHLQAQELSP